MIELLTQYFPQISQEKLEKFAALQPLYEEWNAKINVISPMRVSPDFRNPSAMWQPRLGE